MSDIIENTEIGTDTMDIVEIFADAAARNLIALGKIAAMLSDKAFTSIQKIPYFQLKKYLDGVRKVENDLGKSCKLSERLFSDSKTRSQNAMRVYKTVTSSDTEKKIEYLVDATRSMLLGLIDVEMMFRMFRAVIESMPEDLSYLSSLIEKKGPFKGNLRIHALERAGLMISAGIDAEADIEEQEYHISTLGYAVDRYVLSLNDEDRWNWYKNRRIDSRIFNGPISASDEEVNTMLEKMLNDNKQELIDAAKPQWDSF